MGSPSFALGALLDASQLTLPIALELARPLVERSDGLWIGAIERLPPVAPHVHEPDVAQDAQVFRDRRLRQVQRDDDLADRPLARREVVEDVAPAGLRDRVEGVRG